MVLRCIEAGTAPLSFLPPGAVLAQLGFEAALCGDHYKRLGSALRIQGTKFERAPHEKIGRSA